MGYGCFGQACLHHQGPINTDAKNLIQMIHKRMERRHTKAKRFFLWATICVIVYMWQNLKSGKQLYITPRCAHLRTETTSRMLIRILSR